VNFAVSVSTTATSSVHSKLDYCNSLYHNLPNYQLKWLQQIQNSLAELLLRLLNHHISLPFSNLSTGLRSMNALNINFLLPTKFLQPFNLTILTILSLLKPLAVPAPHLLSLFLVHQTIPSPLLIKNHRSVIQICITPSLESAPCFIPSASPVMSRLTSSFTCQLIFVIITTLIIHHSFTLSIQAQNIPFQQILPTLILLPPSTAFMITGPDRTYYSSRFIFSSFYLLFFCLFRVVD